MKMQPKEKKKGGKDRQEQEESKKLAWNITDFFYPIECSADHAFLQRE